MTFELIDEFRLDDNTKAQIANLLKVCFPEEDFKGRTYFKQLPHYRLIAKIENTVVGQLGLDYRVMAQNGQPIKVVGVIDLAVLPSKQGEGIGTWLLSELDAVVVRHKDNVDFLYLVADKHKFYERSGFKLTTQKVKWLTIEEHINYGLQEKGFSDCLMYKQIGSIEWVEGAELDMFGYWY